MQIGPIQATGAPYSHLKRFLNASLTYEHTVTLYITYREAFKKKRKKSVTFFTFGWGVRTGLRYTFFFLQKHGLKWLNIAFKRPYFLGGGDFRYTFRKIGEGSDPNVKNVTLFLFFLNEGFPNNGKEWD